MDVRREFRTIYSLIRQDGKWVGEEQTVEVTEIGCVGRTRWLQELTWGVRMRRGMVALLSPVVRDGKGRSRRGTHHQDWEQRPT